LQDIFIFDNYLINYEKKGTSIYQYKFILSNTGKFSGAWRSLSVNNRPQTEQISKPDVVPVKQPTTTTNIKPSSNQLIFAGSGVYLEITQLLAEEFRKSHPKIELYVPVSIGSTGAAIQAVADGAIAVGMISRLLKEQEKKLGMTVLPYAQTPLAINTHLAVAEDRITLEGLIQIYKGTKSHWQDGQDTQSQEVEKIPQANRYLPVE